MPSPNVQPATLYVVATPIGHLSDITLRAIDVLNHVDLICCEDTRHSRRLMNEIDCKTPLLSLHEHNERDRAKEILDKLGQGQSIGLVSDAGTPLISDPGYVLVSELVAGGFNVVPVPGASAVITALSASGLPTDHFSFEGFLPNKTLARQKKFSEFLKTSRTIVFYESSHRIEQSLTDLVASLGENRPVVLARELTKTFETYLRGTAEQVLTQVTADSNQRKGEFVLMVGGATEVSDDGLSSPELTLATLLRPLMPPKQAASAMVDVFGGNKKAYYNHLLSLVQE